MKFNVERLKQISRPLTPEEKKEMQYREENREWLLMSEKFALKLRYLLRIKGMSQSELASRMGVSNAQVSKILSGKENLQLKTFAKINSALNVDILKFDIDADVAKEAPVMIVKFNGNRSVDSLMSRSVSVEESPLTIPMCGGSFISISTPMLS